MRAHAVFFAITIAALLLCAVAFALNLLGMIAEETVRQAAIFLFAIAVPAAIVGGVLQARHHRKSWNELAETLHLSPKGRPPGSNVHPRDLLVGDHQGHRVMVQTYTATERDPTRRRSSRRRYTRLGVSDPNATSDYWFQLLHRSDPALSLRPPQGNDFKTGDRALDRRFQAATNDTGRSNRLLEDGLNTFLDGHDRIHEVLIDKGRVMVTFEGFYGEPETVRECLDALIKIAQPLATEKKSETRSTPSPGPTHGKTSSGPVPGAAAAPGGDW